MKTERGRAGGGGMGRGSAGPQFQSCGTKDLRHRSNIQGL